MNKAKESSGGGGIKLIIYQVFIEPWPVFMFQTCEIREMTTLSCCMSVEWIVLNGILSIESQKLISLSLIQLLRRCSSSLIVLHVKHWLSSVPLKFIPHSSIPYLAMINALHSFLVHKSTSSFGFLS